MVNMAVMGEKHIVSRRDHDNGSRPDEQLGRHGREAYHVTS